MSTKRVTFTVVPANLVSKTRRAPGEKLTYKMIIGVEVSGRSVMFSHPNYAKEVSPNAKPTTMSFDFPESVAERILLFALECFAGSTPYDGWDFTEYIMGRQSTPSLSSAEHARKAKTPTSFTRKVVVGRINLVADNGGKVLKSFYGLADNLGLAVLGGKGTFGLVSATGLKRVYGGRVLGYEAPEKARRR